VVEDDVSMDSHHAVDFECLSMGTDTADALPVDSGEIQKNSPVKLNSDWRGLFNKARTMGNLQYFVPHKVGDRIVVSPPAYAVEEGISRWKSSLVGQFLDKPLPFFLVKKSIDIMWKQYGDVEVFSLENGMFICRFSDEVTCENVLDAKIWHISNKPLILRKWMPGMQVKKLTLASIPIWIKLLQLPMELWTPACLSHVASGVGKPLCADKMTEEQKRLGYARVLVEIDLNSECLKELDIRSSSGEYITIGVEYPWLPPKCTLCNGFGHAVYACHRKNDQKVWIPKGHPNKQKQPFPKAAPVVKPVDKVVRRPSGSKQKIKSEEIQIANSFAPIERFEGEVGTEEDFRPGPPHTFLDVFESVLTSREKGQCSSKGGGSPHRVP
jgi:hypothetical protein